MKRRKRRLLGYVLLWLIIVYLSFPFCWTLISSMKSDKDLYTSVPTINFKTLTLSRYISVLTGNETIQTSPGTIVGNATLRSFKSGYLNSLIVASGVTILCLFVGSLSSYGFSRLRTRLMKQLYFGIISTRFLPVIVLTVPYFILMRALGLMNTKIGLVVVYVSFVLPLIVTIMTEFYNTFPLEIEEAACIDGCSKLGTLYRIVLPLSGPAIAASVLVAFVSAWQEFLFALVFTASEGTKTLPVVMAEFFGREGMDLGMTSMGAIMSTVPIVVLAFVAQKYIVKGLTLGSVKG